MFVEVSEFKFTIKSDLNGIEIVSCLLFSHGLLIKSDLNGIEIVIYVRGIVAVRD